MDSVKKIILFRIPMSICNFRCHYCYLSQRPMHFQGIQPEMKFTPEQVGYAMRQERIGGPAFFNFCADGETLLVRDIEKYVRAVLEQGHYVEFVTNCTVTSVLDKFLQFPKDLLKRLEFKCSFHYLELKRKGWLELFANNVRKIWDAGASANIEITPSDELIPFIEDVMQFSMAKFGAYPHLTIARNDTTNGIDYLTNLSMEEYNRTWSRFGSDFWNFKKTIFGNKQKQFCYAGEWGLYIDLTTGDTTRCYTGGSIGNSFLTPDAPLPSSPIGKCPLAHCYNGHALLTLGYIPRLTNVGYGDIRDRKRADGSHWLQPELKAFFNTKLEQSNDELPILTRQRIVAIADMKVMRYGLGRLKNRLFSIVRK